MSSPVSPQRSWHPLPQWFRTLAAERRGAFLLETAKFDDENARTYLFLDPIHELIAQTAEEVANTFLRMDEYLSTRLYAAGFVSYECGYTLHPLSYDTPQHHQEVPLVRVGIFEAPLVFHHRDGTVEGHHHDFPLEDLMPSSEQASVQSCSLEIDIDDYVTRVERVQEYLAAGHSYQVNFTDHVVGRSDGTASTLYRQLLEQQPVPYAAYMDCGAYQILSFSPELFYRATRDCITVKPMKGTWPRGSSLENDRLAAEALQQDTKNRAEHVTIVDLLRNDLGRICTPGSVKVERLMDVERYRTLHQMTSTISGAPIADKTPSEIFQSLFPSGSITGAPKRRTMEIIHELERGPRGVYTGAIGWFGPNGQACLNVAIRTLTVRRDCFVMGVGGGITLDSDAHDEFRECQLKASFLQASRSNLYLIETMRATSGSIPLFERHLGRIRDSAEYFQIDFDEQGLRSKLALALIETDDSEWRIRLTLQESGEAQIACSPLRPDPWTGNILLSPEKMDASDISLYHKTSQRQHFDAALANARERGFDEVIFQNSDGFLTEGAISNLFLMVKGIPVTPALHCGLLPGVQRAHLLASWPLSRCAEISLSDLDGAEEIWVCNALRGNRPVRTIHDSQGNILWRSRPRST